MTSDQTANLLYSLLFLVLVVSSLAARRLSVGATIKYAFAWLAIFAGAVVLYSFRGIARQGWEQVRAELFPGAPVQDGKTIRVKMEEDGHFHVDAQINGHMLNFLIDSGATTTTLSQTGANAAGVPIDAYGFPVATQTANGVAMMKRARIGSLSIGSIVRTDFPVLVSSDQNEAVNLLGMNFLSSLRNWRVEGREMILES
ncbi:retropepsin-like aspartic protease family protein [Aquisediminimonas profunda]|uniref:retropepsin-like aspartic protease family protein n=1 Tax=Aquisediminimonas profunda TaxID=1550733 RepID=UPI001C6373DB|nr:TIGR02281 family clan AA aspartic protease [Aquisediminimonas profunda]